MNQPQPQLTALDWIAVVLAGALAAALCAFPVFSRPFLDMYRELRASFPTITRLAISVWFPVGLGVLGLASLGVGLSPGQPLGRRRVLIVATFVGGLAGLAFCLVGLYWPLWQVAGNVR